MTVRAKFYVAEKKDMGHYNSQEVTAGVKMLPVTSGSTENESFFRWTPSGEINIAILNPDAAKQFKVGKTYYIDFTEAE